MSLRSAVGIGLVSGLVLAGTVGAQKDEEKVFGAFRAACETNADTQARKCQVWLRPANDLFIENRMMPFLVFIYPDEPGIGTMGSVPKLRVDKNPPIVGDCTQFQSSSESCQFEDKVENERFLKELAAGKALHIEVGKKKFDFDLGDYRKALAAYQEMAKPGTAAPATPRR